MMDEVVRQEETQGCGKELTEGSRRCIVYSFCGQELQERYGGSADVFHHGYFGILCWGRDAGMCVS